jgi:hypothetical protein
MLDRTDLWQSINTTDISLPIREGYEVLSLQMSTIAWHVSLTSLTALLCR